jgi:hypothetical protein
LVIRNEALADRLRDIAEMEKRSPEEVLAEMIARYDPPPRPASSLTDADIELPDDLLPEQVEDYRQAVRKVRPKIYRIARRYWEKVGDKERLALTDEELDKRFWVIDHEGVPRFKEEKGRITLPPDPMEAFYGSFDDKKDQG